MPNRCETGESAPPRPLSTELPRENRSSPKRRGGRKTAVVAGFALLVSLGTASFFWVDIAARYYILRIRSDPTYLVRIIEAPDRPVVRRIILSVLDTDQGREALHQAFVYGALEVLRKKYRLSSPAAEIKEEAGGYFAVREDAFIWQRPVTRVRQSVFLFDDSALYHLMKLREKIGGRVVTVPECPGLRFRFEGTSPENPSVLVCRPEVVPLNGE